MLRVHTFTDRIVQRANHGEGKGCIRGFAFPVTVYNPRQAV